MVNLSRWQSMHTRRWVSGTQSLRAGGWSGGWNLAGEMRFLQAEFRSHDEEGVCVGVLPANTQNRGTNQSNRGQVGVLFYSGVVMGSPAEVAGDSSRPDDTEQVS